MTDSRPTVVDLFAGAGGLSLGFQAAGCRIAAAADHDEASALTLRRNLGAHETESDRPVILGGAEADLRLRAWRRLVPDGSVDILVGGPPCQGFSLIGRAKLRHEARKLGRLRPADQMDLLDDPAAVEPVVDERNDLYEVFMDAARVLQPRVVVMENVPGMLRARGADYAGRVRRGLTEVGYRVEPFLLEAAAFGVPQWRSRIFFIGFRRDTGIVPAAPVQTHFTGGRRTPGDPDPSTNLSLFAGSALPASGEALLSPTTVGEALSDLPVIVDHLPPSDPGRQELECGLQDALAYRSDPTSAFARLMRNWPGLGEPSSVTAHTIRRTPRDYMTFRRMRPGDRYPEALACAISLFEERLAELERVGSRPDRDSERFRTERESIVPPYGIGKFLDKWHKLDPREPSWTVVAHLSKDTYSHIHYDDQQARSISAREAARLQSFPDAFTFEGSLADQFRQIGNAVPPLLAWAIASQLLVLLGSPSRPLPLLANPHGYRSRLHP